MATSPILPATEKTASKLLPPKRRRQIEIWLDEAVSYEAQQNCASDKRHGHVSDLQLYQTQHKNNQRKTTSASTVCGLCDRYFQGEGPFTATLDTSEEPTDPQSRRNNSISKLRGLKLAMAALRPKNSSEKYDPALSTKMFVVSSVDDDENSDKSSSNAGLGSSDNNDNGKRILGEKMARLKRAQKLLEKSQPKHGKG